MLTRLRERDRDLGAITVITAIAAVTLFTFGALAVDLGNAWAQKRAMQTTADLAALAGASGLPDVLEARERAVDYLKRNADPLGDVDLDCDLTSPSCWQSNNDYEDGEIDFFGDDSNSDGEYTSGGLDGSGNPVPDERTSGNRAVAIRVIPPRAEVEFLLASAAGFSSITVTQPATAAIGSAVGLGVPPFYLVGSDSGLECIKDETAPAIAPTWAIKASHSVTSVSPMEASPGSELTVTGAGLPISNSSKAQIGGEFADINSRTATTWRLIVPPLPPGVHDIVISSPNPGGHDATISGFVVLPAASPGIAPG